MFPFDDVIMENNGLEEMSLVTPTRELLIILCEWEYFTVLAISAKYFVTVIDRQPHWYD